MKTDLGRALENLRRNEGQPLILNDPVDPWPKYHEANDKRRNTRRLLVGVGICLIALYGAYLGVTGYAKYKHDSEIVRGIINE